MTVNKRCRLEFRALKSRLVHWFSNLLSLKASIPGRIFNLLDRRLFVTTSNCSARNYLFNMMYVGFDVILGKLNLESSMSKPISSLHDKILVNPTGPNCCFCRIISYCAVMHVVIATGILRQANHWISCYLACVNDQYNKLTDYLST